MRHRMASTADPTLSSCGASLYSCRTHKYFGIPGLCIGRPAHAHLPCRVRALVTRALSVRAGRSASGACVPCTSLCAASSCKTTQTWIMRHVLVPCYGCAHQASADYELTTAPLHAGKHCSHKTRLQATSQSTSNIFFSQKRQRTFARTSVGPLLKRATSRCLHCGDTPKRVSDSRICSAPGACFRDC